MPKFNHVTMKDFNEHPEHEILLLAETGVKLNSKKVFARINVFSNSLIYCIYKDDKLIDTVQSFESAIYTYNKTVVD